MEYRRLGDSGLLVSPLCLGTMTFGRETGEAAARRMLRQARAAGVNFIDTADVYAQGESEAVLGRLIARDRDDWVVATKVGGAWDPAPNRSGLGRKWMMHQIDASLQRLNTDYVDIYYFHIDDRATPLEESLFAMADILRAGKARYFGISNYTGWRTAELVGACDRLGMVRPIVSQPYYNAVNRMPEVEILPACARFGLGVVPYSPVARGVLTGKYAPDRPPPKGSRAARRDERMMETEYRAESMRIARLVKARAEACGMTAAQFAVNWVLANGLVSSVIAGPRTFAQWRDYLGALEHPFTAEDEAFMDGLVPPGHPSTPGFTDPRRPVEGRRPRTA